MKIKLFITLLLCLSLTTFGAVNLGIDFTAASEKTINSVVFIKVVSIEEQKMYDPFFGVFGNIGQVSSSGSGVIISQDGYIVTNYHVVTQNPQKIEVILNNNKRSFNAKVIGVDPSTDLAVLKIEAKNLPPINYANSDDVKIGQWVLAVGNPFNLTSSVTAGIVSAKGRNINIVQNQFPIESFIQTDAAINPGNSGGALVDLEGNLVGINTAILSKTGSYAGYGFAIPVNIVKKVVKDIQEFGFVQRGFIEAEFVDIDTRLANKLNDDNLTGIYVKNVYAGGNAALSGLKKGDIISKFDGKDIDSRSAFDELLSYHRPGDKVKIVLKVETKEKEIEIILNNDKGVPSLETNSAVQSKSLGASFEEISKIEKERFKLLSGIRLFNIKPNGLISRLNLPENFIVTSFNYQKFNKPEELIKVLETVRGKILFEGINPNGTKGYYQSMIY
jgi:S1-C subfamily serine protease